MTEKPTSDRKPDTAGLEAMKNLPREGMPTLTREEVKLRDCVTAEH